MSAFSLETIARGTMVEQHSAFRPRKTMPDVQGGATPNSLHRKNCSPQGVGKETTSTGVTVTVTWAAMTSVGRT